MLYPHRCVYNLVWIIVICHHILVEFRIAFSYQHSINNFTTRNHLIIASLLRNYLSGLGWVLQKLYSDISPFRKFSILINYNPSKNYWQFSSTILIQFSCNSHAIIDEIFRNAPAILTYNSHPILTRQFSSNSHLQFSSNSHLQFSSNSHLTILIQFSPDNSHPIFT